MQEAAALEGVLGSLGVQLKLASLELAGCYHPEEANRGLNKPLSRVLSVCLFYICLQEPDALENRM